MWTWWILLASLAAGSIVSTLHYALRDFSLVRIQDLVERRGRKKAVEAVLADVDGHALAMGALRAVSNVLVTVCILVLFGAFHVEPTAPGADPAVVVSFGRIAAAAGVAWALIYVFSLVLPMSVAEHAGERMIRSFASFLRLAHFLAWPMRGLGVLDIAVKRLAGVAHVSEAEELEDEILSAVTEGEREGNLGETQREMIEAVVDLRSRRVEDVMTPRTEIEGFELTDDLEFIRGFIEKAGHSRIPVYTGDLDHIIGILYAKDLLPWLGRDPSAFKLRPILRKPVWVPETKPLIELMYELRARKVHLAIVLDEYGGTTGLVTFEDILEEIVGDIQDEYEALEEATPEIVVDKAARTAEIEARAYIEDANEALESIGVEIPESQEYDTVGGWVLATLGHIPVAEEFFSTADVVVTVLDAEPTRVNRIRLEARSPAPADEGGAPEPAPIELEQGVAAGRAESGDAERAGGK